MQEPAFAAFIGLDWADKKHDVCLQVAGSADIESLRSRAQAPPQSWPGPK